MENTEKPASAGAPITRPRDRWWTRLVSYAKRKVDERTAKKQKESPTDRAARVAATATVWIAFFTFVSVAVSIGTFVILRSQLQEMHDGGVDTHNLAIATKDAADLNRILAEGSAAAWLMPSAQELNRNFLSFGVQNMGGIAAGNVGVSVKVELTRLSNSQTLWTESFTFDTVKYLPPKQNTNGQAVLTISKYTRQDFERIAKEQEALTLNWTATYDNGFKRQVQQKGCVQYLALFKPPEVRAMPQWVGCEAAPQLLRQLQAASEQWSLQ